MDVREKLVELLNEVQETGVNEIPAGFGCTREYVKNEKVASHLISHGVTVQDNTEITDEPLKQLRNAPLTVLCEEPTIEVVQEWISVKDRLPEIVSTHKRYRSTVKKSIRVLCVCVQKSGKTMVKEGYCEWYNDYPEPRWQIPGTIDEVTHWQYLPQPPKGE